MLNSQNWWPAMIFPKYQQEIRLFRVSWQALSASQEWAFKERQKEKGAHRQMVGSRGKVMLCWLTSQKETGRDGPANPLRNRQGENLEGVTNSLLLLLVPLFPKVRGIRTEQNLAENVWYHTNIPWHHCLFPFCSCDSLGCHSFHQDLHWNGFSHPRSNR